MDNQKIIFFSAGIIAGLVAAWARRWVPGAEGFLANLIVTIFSVLAGFLSVALNMVVTSSPKTFRSPLSRERYVRQVRGRILRHSFLFYTYLVILFVVFASELTRPAWPGASRLLEVIYVGMSAAGLFWSFSVPATIGQLHEEQTTLAQAAEAK